MRVPEACPYRESLGRDEQREVFCCNLARQVVGIDDKGAFAVQRDTCDTCCTSWQPGPSALNGAVASVAWAAASRILGDDQVSSFARQEAQRTLRHVLPQLELIADDAADRPETTPKTHPVHSRADRAGAASQVPRSHPKFRWVAALLTAPRRQPTIRQTLQSLDEAGMPAPHIFAEPGSPIPSELGALTVTKHGRELGNLGNFMAALWSIYVSDPAADCYAVFQDDIELADGLRPWCDRQFWPQDAGLVSLYTSRVYTDDTAGWRVLRLGLTRTFGALAFVFRPDVLKQFLADGWRLDMPNMRTHGSDAVVGEWATRRGIGIAYHTPSLVQHIGSTSAIPGPGHGIARASWANATKSVTGISRFQPARRESGSVGLVGWNTASGLGYQNRDMATHLAFDRWLVPIRGGHRTLAAPKRACPVQRVPVQLSDAKLKAWLHGLDWVLFVEQPYFRNLPQLARQLDISVACVPNWEFADLESEWVKYVDLMICPTRFTYGLMTDWKTRFGFSWDIVYVSWPIDALKFKFRQRDRCQSFLFVNGTGGLSARHENGSVTRYQRKGLDVVLDAARQIPRIPLFVYSQTRDIPRVPDNVTLRKATRRNEELYLEGDICVQPSYWEGLGLPLLECQAAGLPLITTDAPPMNEHQPFRTVPVGKTEIVSVTGRHPITSARADPAALAAILEQVYEADIAEASADARRFVEREHGWDHARQILAASLRK